MGVLLELQLHMYMLVREGKKFKAFVTGMNVGLEVGIEYL